jgi:succinyl-CoA synthetase beta subunit
MNLHEYQGKQLLATFKVPVPVGYLVTHASEAKDIATRIQKETNTDKWAVKAQVHAGGRGKGGGVKIASEIEQVVTYSEEIIGMTLVTPQTGAAGKDVHQVLIEENIFYKGEEEIAEIYMSIMLDRSEGKSVIIYSPYGGMDIEKIAEEMPEQIFREYVDTSIGLQPYQSRRIAFQLGLSGKAYQNMVSFAEQLFLAYCGTDATLLEINPVIKTSDSRIVAADCKMVVDDNALFRHLDIKSMRDIREEDPTEVKAKEYGLNYVKLDGNVGCMVNGAGLAMATMDIIKQSGGEPANFLDVGGTADAKRVEQAFRIILEDNNVKAIFVNIFGGIVRCDRVANGIVDAYNNLGNISVPIIVRLQGTNSEEAKTIIDNSGLQVFSAIFLNEAATLIQKVIQQ